ncbi:MAG: GTP-binding protein [Mariprofundales bacterium]
MTSSLLNLNKNMELLRLVTVGSVDDGKSTLIGRLLFDTKGAFEDQLMAVRKENKSGSDYNDVLDSGNIDLARLTDGLQSEREQGITIDVAYRYFATSKRKFILADCPGHEQYTRNAVTGATTANVGIILVDARNGVMPQSRRHSIIVGLLGLPHLIVAVNKMDLVDYSEEVFNNIKAEMRGFCAAHHVNDLICVPISALVGDMVVSRGDNIPWYDGDTILETLENIEVSDHIAEQALRFPVQLVNRPQTAELPDYRGFMGRVASGSVNVGDKIRALPSGMTSTVKNIVTFDGELNEAFAPQSVTITLNDEIDVSRGTMLVHDDDNTTPLSDKTVDAMVCWMGDEPLSIRKKYLVKHTTNTLKAMISAIPYKLNINTLEKDSAADSLAMNDIGRVSFRLQQPMMFDAYENNRSTGSFVIIDSFTNNTVGAAMICTK